VGSVALSRAHFCVWCHFLLPRPGSHAAQSSPQPGSIGTPKNGVSNGASRVERRVALMSEMASPLPDSSLTHRDTARLLLPRDSAVRRCFIRRSPMSSPSTVSLPGLSLPRSRSPIVAHPWSSSTTTSSFSGQPWRRSYGGGFDLPTMARQGPVPAPRPRSPRPPSTSPRCTQPRRSTALLRRSLAWSSSVVLWAAGAGEGGRRELPHAMAKAVARSRIAMGGRPSSVCDA
jgi:hypothetical protein